MNARKSEIRPFMERRTTPAAPREITVTVQATDRMTRRRSSAWDPYEVWKTRVKTPQSSNQ